MEHMPKKQVKNALRMLADCATATAVGNYNVESSLINILGTAPTMAMQRYLERLDKRNNTQ